MVQNTSEGSCPPLFSLSTKESKWHEFISGTPASSICKGKHTFIASTVGINEVVSGCLRLISLILKKGFGFVTWKQNLPERGIRLFLVKWTSLGDFNFFFYANSKFGSVLYLKKDFTPTLKLKVKANQWCPRTKRRLEAEIGTRYF